MSLVQDRCICLRKIEYSETSQILTLLGRERGLVRVIARGAHRKTKAGASKFGGGLDLLDVGDAVFTDRPEKDLATLTEWTLREGHPPLRNTLRGLYLGFYSAELTGLMIEEHDPHPELFDALEHLLLELGTPRAEQAFLAFELSLLRVTGYLPQLGGCVSCGTLVGDRAGVSFDPGHGGVLCRGCEGAFPSRLSFDGRLLGVMQYFINLAKVNRGTLAEVARRLPVLSRAQADPINRLLAEHVEHTLQRRLRMPKYVVGNGPRRDAGARASAGLRG